MKRLMVGVLAFQGDVQEHIFATVEAARKLKQEVVVVPIRTKDALKHIDGLIIPGGESTTLSILCEREGMVTHMRKIKNIFGTCAGAIFLAKKVAGKAKNQKTLDLMNIDIERNAYGTQTESFEAVLQSSFGEYTAVFIRAPRITAIGKNVRILAEMKGNVVACEERKGKTYYLATSFHPELTGTTFHEHFLKHITKH